MIKIKNMDRYIDMLNKDHRNFSIEEKRNSVRVIDENGKVKAIIDKKTTVSKIQKKQTALKKGEMLSIFATVKKSFISKIAKDLKESKDIELVPQLHPSRFTNKKLWNSLRKGRVFYYIDVNHCYWRIAFQQGYISEYYYNKILGTPEIKVFRNISLASVKANKSRKYFSNGKQVMEITEDNTILDRAYANIRHTAWNIMGNILHEIGEENCIKYVTDGVMVFKKHVNLICNHLDAHDLEYTILKCKKINSTEIETTDVDTGEISTEKF